MMLRLSSILLLLGSSASVALVGRAGTSGALIGRASAIGLPHLAPHLARCSVSMGVRTAEQLAAYPGAKDDVPVLSIDHKAAARTLTKLGAAVMVAFAIGVAARRLGVTQAALTRLGRRAAVVLALAARTAACIGRHTLSSAVSVMTGPAAGGLLERFLTRLVDYGVPALVVALLLLGGKDGPSEDEEEAEMGGGPTLGVLSRSVRVSE